MRLKIVIVAGCLLLVPAPALAKTHDPRLVTAERFIDAFYSFNQARLRRAMRDAPASQPDTLYYQQWAVGGHYKVLKRHACRFEKADQVSCGITVKDDLVPALGSSFRVTDVFHFRFDRGRIIKVWNSSDDPPEFDQAMDWLRKERPAIFTGPCRKMFKGGPTPQVCVRSIVAGFREFSARQKQ